MLKGIGSALELAAQSALSVVGIRAYEQPPNEVVGRAGPCEIRAYGPRLAVETTLEGGTRDQAFGLLAGYIFGKNRARGGGAEKIAMTTPVEMRSEKIAMTAPVETAGAGGRRVAMRFFLPRALTRASAPEPVDPRVRIVEAPGETMAVLRFSGATDHARIAERKDALLRELHGSAWEPAGGEPVFFGYDPPFTPPFLRRNEVAVPVRRRA